MADVALQFATATGHAAFEIAHVDYDLTGDAGVLFVSGLVVTVSAATAADMLRDRENGRISR